MSIFGRGGGKGRPTQQWRTIAVNFLPDVTPSDVRLDDQNSFTRTIDNPRRWSFLCPVSQGAFNLHVLAPGFVRYDRVVSVPPGGVDIIVGAWPNPPNAQQVILPALQSLDPVSQWTPAQILKVRGSMWTCRGDELLLPFGPRPGQPSNILNISQAYLYPDPEAAIKKYAARGYTHADVGPLPMGEGGYHGEFADAFDFRTDPDKYCDFLQLLRTHGVCPILFAKPDNWTVADLDNKGLTSIYGAKRFQQLVQWVIPRGWEPSQDDSNRTYVEGLEWGHRVFPHAYYGIHMTTDFDCPGNNDDLTPGRPGFIGAPACWANVAPLLHMWFVQNYGYMDDGSPVPTPTFVKNFTDQFRIDTPGSLTSRFEHGDRGWPAKRSAFGATRLLVCAAEFAATADYHWDWPEEEARKLGDLALAAGADGVLDGCH